MPPKSTRIDWFSLLGLVMLLAAFAGSAVWVAYATLTRGDIAATSRKTIRVVHSVAARPVQAEFQRLAAAYERRHPDVRVVIQSIPRRAYRQWVTTQFIGDTAPDLVEIGNRFLAEWTSLATRYMTPLTSYVMEPNPYNKGTSLEQVPWRQTYIDGMQGGYWPHLTEFFSVPLTVRTVRMYYNKDLFEAAAGSRAPPRDFREWMHICRAVQEYGRARGQTLFPIAMWFSRSSRADFFDWYAPCLLGGMGDKYDTGYWGFPGDMESVVFGVQAGTFDLKDRRIRAVFTLLREMARYFQPSFVSDDEAQTRFLFIQGHAAMLVASIADYEVLEKNADFSVGVFDFPLPRRDNPQYGRYVAGPYSEEPLSQFHFALSRRSRYPEIALDFMKFCTSQKINEAFNAHLQWFPAIRTARPLEKLKVFAPHIEGAARYPDLKLRGLAGTCNLWFTQHYPLYLTGELSFDAFMDRYTRIVKEEGIRDLFRRDERFERVLVQTERNIAKSKAKMLFVQAGDFRSDRVMGQRSTYQLTIEVLNLMQHGMTTRAYTSYHLKAGDITFP